MGGTAAPAPATQSMCSRDFPALWTSFVHALADTAVSGAPLSRAPSPPLPLALPAAVRVMAVGDLHGDLPKARRAFRAAGLIDASDRWAGGSTVAVQVGDVLDRGGEEIALYYWLSRLQRQAAAAGGALHVLLGNHEAMGAMADFRYATPEAYEEFARWARVRALELSLLGRCGCCGADEVKLRATQAREKEREEEKEREKRKEESEKGGGQPPTPWYQRLLSSASASPSVPSSPSLAPPHPALWAARMRELWEAPGKKARRMALAAGSGELAERFLAPCPVALQVGSSLFVHGGVLPEHAALGLAEINAQTRKWLLHGLPRDAPPFLKGRDAVVWLRRYSWEESASCECATLQQALDLVPGARRMVVGHTIQSQGINAACDGRVYRVDVGLSKGCADGAPEALEIRDDAVARRVNEPRIRGWLLDKLWKPGGGGPVPVAA